MPNPNLPINARMNTYIGARYVPKFAEPTEWSAQNKYNPLTIVTYQGNSYTSKTFVPVGVDITNTTYWAPTGNYNAQMEAYRNEVVEYKEIIEPLNGIRPQLSNRKWRNIVMIGDSWGQGTQTAGVENVNGWGYFTKKFISYSSIQEKYVGGAGFCASPTYLSIIQGMGIQNMDSVDLIVIQGNVNDMGSYDYGSVVNAIGELMTWVSANMPNAVVLACCVGRRKIYKTIQENAVSGVLAASGRFKNFYGLDMRDTFETSDFLSDNLHLTQLGYQKVGYGIASAIIGQYTHKTWTQKTIKAGGFEFYFMCVDGMGILFANFSISNPPFNLDNGVMLLPVTEGLKLQSDLYIPCSCSIVVDNPSGQNEMVFHAPARLHFDGDNIRINFMGGMRYNIPTGTAVLSGAHDLQQVTINAMGTRPYWTF